MPSPPAPPSAAGSLLRVLGWLCCLAGALACDAETATPRGRGCEAGAECGELACVPDRSESPADLEPLPLICEDEAAGREPGAACESGSDCASGVCVLAGACLQPCATDDDCAKDQRCQAVFARGSATRLHPLRACVAQIDLPRGSRSRSELRTDAFSGSLDELSLPGSPAPSLFVIEHLDDDSWPLPSSDSDCRPALCARALEQSEPDDPDDASLFDLETLAAEPDGPLNPIAVGDHVNVLTVLIPNGPRARPAERGYRLRVESKRAGSARITRVDPPRSSGGRLDLNLFIVGEGALARGESEPTELLAAALEEVDRIFEPAGVFVGEVREIEVAGALPEAGVAIDGAEASQGFAHLALQYGVYPQLPELFKLSAGAGNPAVDVFFVASLDVLPEGAPGGIAGGTPLPLGMHGTAGSGVAIATGQPGLSARALGRSLAHELGHALGLFHTTETSGLVFDPLPDTPVCSRERDEDGEGLHEGDCQGAGADNLMFPTTEPDAAALTQDQRNVLAGAAILQ